MRAILWSLSFAVFLVACYFGLRGPIWMVVIALIVMAYGALSNFFLWVHKKAEGNKRLSEAEIDNVKNFSAIGVLIATIVINFAFLSWINSHTPIWGGAYAERVKREEAIGRASREEIEIMSDAQYYVMQSLKDPSSAKFSDGKLGREGSYCGYVNSKNGFGAYAGQQRYVVKGALALVDDGSGYFSSEWLRLCQ